MFVNTYHIFFVTVTELDIPPECEESDSVSITKFWHSVELMHLAMGINGELKILGVIS